MEHKDWEVYQLGSQYFFDANGPCFGRQTFGPYETRELAEVSMTECDAMWE